MNPLKVKNFSIGKKQPLAIICGPCVIESEESAVEAAAVLKEIFTQAGIHFIYKSSYDKANRSAYDGFRGPGLQEGLRILEKIQREFDVPVTTDVHAPEEAAAAGEVCDILQIPAFLCRQTDLIVAAGRTGKIVNIKKGQFMAPWDMGIAVEKVQKTNNTQVMLTDRGVTFGYNNLVSDMRAIPIMQKFDVPVCFDATHSVQLPGGQGRSSGGQREFIPILARAAIAAGADCLFMEAHPDPKNAKSDASSVIDFKDLPKLLQSLKALYQVCQEYEV